MDPDTIAAVRLVMLTVLGIGLFCVTAYFLVRFIGALDKGGPPSVDRHWGGLGGSMSGWRMSNSLVHLLAGLSFAILGTLSILAAAPLADDSKLKELAKKNEADAAKNAADARQNATRSAEIDAEAKKNQARAGEIDADAKKRQAELDAAAKKLAEAEARTAAVAHKNQEDAAANETAAKKNRQDVEQIVADRKSVQAAVEALLRQYGDPRTGRVVVVPLGGSACIWIERPPVPAKSGGTTKQCPPTSGQQKAELTR